MKISINETDNKLVNYFRNGESSALDILVDRHKDKIYNSIYFLVKDEWVAEDIFQETFIRIIDTLRNKHYEESGKFLPWALRISHNLCIDYFRKQKRAMKMIDTDASDVRDIFDTIMVSNESPEVLKMREQTFSQVHSLVAMLPEDQREVIVLRHFAELSFKEIAELMDCSINTALGRMRYGLINLRKMIQAKQIIL